MKFGLRNPWSEVAEALVERAFKHLDAAIPAIKWIFISARHRVTESPESEREISEWLLIGLKIVNSHSERPEVAWTFMVESYSLYRILIQRNNWKFAIEIFRESMLPTLSKLGGLRDFGTQGEDTFHFIKMRRQIAKSITSTDYSLFGTYNPTGLPHLEYPIGEELKKALDKYSGSGRLPEFKRGEPGEQQETP